MSFIILFLIIIMLYASLSTYKSIYKVIFMTVFLSGMTSAFLMYGLKVFKTGDIFVILNTEMNMTIFIHACVIWVAADLIVFLKIIKNYRQYVEVNAS